MWCPRGCRFPARARSALLSERRRHVGSLPRFNPLGIQMLSKPLHDHLFGTEESQVTPEQVERTRKHLEAQRLWGKEVPVMPDVDFELPKLEGSNIDEHFRAIARQQLAPYLPLVNTLCDSSILPTMPTTWSYSPGWTKYEGGKCIPVACPDSDALVLDVEVCVTEGPIPTMATAVSPTCWYSWVSDRLTRDQDYATQGRRRLAPDDMIPLETQSGSTNPVSGSWREKVIVGHNISYDRARIKEQYFLTGPKTRFLDTLSLHVCVAGQTAHQQLLWKAYNKRISSDDSDVSRSKLVQWLVKSSPNTLKDAYKLHCGGKEMDKTQRNVFVKGSMSDIREDFQNLMTYCAQDVVCTHDLLKAVFPKFRHSCPHPVTFAGMFEMGSAILPVNQSWEEYIAGAEYMYEDMQHAMKVKLMSVANQAARFTKNERYKDDIWLSQLDWSAKSLRNKTMTKIQMKKLLKKLEEDQKSREEHFQSLGTATAEEKEEYKFLISSTDPSCIKRNVHLPGYPQWFRALCPRRDGPSWQPGPADISAQMRLVPYLLRMKWNGHPLHWRDKMGWGYLVAVDDDKDKEVMSPSDFPLDELSDELLHEAGDSKTNLSQYEGTEPSKQRKKKPNDIVTLNQRNYYFFKIPHKNGPQANCGSPLTKDYIHKMEGGILTSSAGQHGSKILKLNSAISFWRSARSRILDQFVVWRHNDDAVKESYYFTGQGCILPMVRVAGTVTRRAVEATWLTASNAKESRVGSELKSMVRAPPGYHLVGADVDSQELWIASILGDTNFTELHGCTALSWMTLQGNKSEGTDLHSTTARTIGISRDQAKILNYGRFYGAGRPFVELLLKQFNPSLTETEVAEKATQLYSVTKGVRRSVLTKRGYEQAKKLKLPIGDDLSLSPADFKLMHEYILSTNPKRYYKLINSRYWSGGSESYTFNKLEELALSPQHYPETPVLGCKISQALSPENVNKEFVTSRVNWAVQSSAVDYLHLTLVCMKWLMDAYGIDGRFCISIHDEVRYLVRSEDRYRAALALQISNLLTRSMFSYKLGMKDLPQSVAFFSAVDVDLVLRKEVNMDCVTPSNLSGLSEGHGIPHGESLDIHQILEKTSGLLTPQA